MSGTSVATRSTTSRQNSSGMAASNSAAVIVPYSARDGMAPPPSPGAGNQSRRTWRRASTIAASKRMTGKRRATARIVWITCSRTAAWLKSSCAVSFQGKQVPSLPW